MKKENLIDFENNIWEEHFDPTSYLSSFPNYLIDRLLNFSGRNPEIAKQHNEGWQILEGLFDFVLVFPIDYKIRLFI